MKKTLVSVCILTLFSITIIASVLYKFIPLTFSDVVVFCYSVASVSVMYIPGMLYLVLIAGMAGWGVCSGLRLVAMMMRTHEMTTKSRLPGRHEMKSYANVRVIERDEQIAFCSGFIIPTIYVSTGLISAFSEDELNAVLEHEMGHIRNGDTRIVPTIAFLSSLFPFIPLIKELTNMYRFQIESRADAAAVRMMGEQKSLLNAFKKMITHDFALHPAVTAFSSIEFLEARVSMLVRGKSTLKISSSGCIVSVVFILFMMTGLLLPVEAKTISSTSVQDIPAKCPSNLPLYTPAFITIAR